MLLSFASALSFVASGKLPMTFNGSHMLASQLMPEVPCTSRLRRRQLLYFYLSSLLCFIARLAVFDRRKSEAERLL